jgi:site-specific DNA-methyltransferase (adenine-specific)
MNLTDRIRITNEDNMALMARYPDKHFDLAIVDPPYGIGVNHNMGRRKGDKPSDYKPAEWDNQPPSFEYFAELMRVSVNQIVWGANHFISRMPFDSSCWLMWDKGFSEDVTFAQFELAWTSFGSTCKKFNAHPSQQHRIHPTQKPVALYKWLLKNYATPDMKILDTHLGSGSIAIACHEYGCDLTACELDPDYYRDAIKRIQNHINQTNLFL